MAAVRHTGAPDVIGAARCRPPRERGSILLRRVGEAERVLDAAKEQQHHARRDIPRRFRVESLPLLLVLRRKAGPVAHGEDRAAEQSGEVPYSRERGECAALRGHLLDRVVGDNEVLLAANRRKVFENDCNHQVEHHERADEGKGDEVDQSRRRRAAVSHLVGAAVGV